MPNDRDTQADFLRTVERARQGDAEAFEALYREFVKGIFNYVFRLVGSVPEAEDLTQETFLKVHCELPNLRAAEYFRYWIYRIARNEVYQRARKHKRVNEVSLDNDETHLGDFVRQLRVTQTPEDEALRGEFNDVVAQALDQMPHKLREVFVLGVMQRFSYDEITRIVNRSVLSVKTDIYRARLIAREVIQKYMQDHRT